RRPLILKETNFIVAAIYSDKECVDGSRISLCVPPVVK
ncbi:hypothetical protein Q604_UNBC00019G0001, partial [human gut metagenome]